MRTYFAVRRVPEGVTHVGYKDLFLRMVTFCDLSCDSGVAWPIQDVKKTDSWCKACEKAIGDEIALLNQTWIMVHGE